MKNLLAKLRGKKTYFTGAVGIGIAAASLFGVNLPGVPVIAHDTAIQTIVTSLLAMFLRNGMPKAE